jgi:hypothetical protein
VGGVQCIANITAELHLSIAFVRATEKAIQLFGLIGNSTGIQAYSSGDTMKRRSRPGDTMKRRSGPGDTKKRRSGPGDTMKRIHRFGDTIKLIIKCLWGDAENTLSALSR